MNKILLICSHLESGSENIVSNLNSGSKLQQLNSNYNNINSLIIKKNNFEYRKRPKVYFDHIIYNHEFSCKELFKYVNFVYIIGDPRKTITNIVYNKIYDQKTAFNYYCFRIRRIYEMIKKSKNYLVFFNENLNDSIYEKIHQMLGIKDRLKIKIKQKIKQDVKIDKNLLDEAEDFYEKYRYRIQSN